jgi:PAS domain S-box-containing protein
MRPAESCMPALTIIMILILAITIISLSFLAHDLYLVHHNRLNAPRDNWKTLAVQSTTLLNTVFVIPMASGLMSMVRGAGGGNCSSSPAVSYLIAITFTIILIFAITFMGILVFTVNDERVVSDAAMGRANTRIDAAFLFGRIYLAIVFTLGYGVEIGNSTRWFLLLNVLVVSAPFAIGYIFFIPYYRFEVNQMRLTTIAVYCWAWLCTLAIQVYDAMNGDSQLSVAENQFHTFTVMFFFALPLIVCSSVLCHLTRRQHLLETPVLDLSSPLEVELKCRLYMQEVTKFTQLMHSRINALDKHSDKSAIISAFIADVLDGELDSTDEDMWELTMDMGDDSHRKRISRGNIQISQSDIVSHLYQRQLVAHARDALWWYRESSVRQFPESSILLIFTGMFCMQFLDNAQMAANALRKATLRSMRWDLGQAVSRLEHMLTQRLQSTHGVQAVLSYLSYHRHLSEARKGHREAITRRAQFWAALNATNKEFGKIHALGAEYTNAATKAARLYQALHELNPNVPDGLRAYGSFLMDIQRDNSAGSAMIAKADALEEKRNMQENDHNEDEAGNRISPLRSTNADIVMDLFDDRNAVVTISGQPNTLGEVISMNPGGCQLLGCTQSEITGKNVSAIMPEPFGSLHNMFLHRYLETGQQRVISSTRMVFAKVRSSHIVPVYLWVEQISSSTTGTVFMGVLKRVPTKDDFFFLDSDMHVTQMTSGCNMIFGPLTNNQLALTGGTTSDGSDSEPAGKSDNNGDDKEVLGPVTQWLPEFGAMYPLMLTEKGITIPYEQGSVEYELQLWASAVAIMDKCITIVRVKSTLVEAKEHISIIRRPAIGTDSKHAIVSLGGSPSLQAKCAFDNGDESPDPLPSDRAMTAEKSQARSGNSTSSMHHRHLWNEIMSSRTSSKFAIPAIRHMKYAFLAALAIIIILLATSYELQRQSAVEIETTMNNVHLSGRRLQELYYIAHNVMMLSYVARSYEKSSTFAAYNAQLASLASQLETTHTQLYLSNPSLPPQERAHLTSGYITIYEQGDGAPTARQVNVHEAISGMISQAKLVAKLPQAQVLPDSDEHVYFVLANYDSETQVYNALNVSTSNFQAYLATVHDDMNAAELGICISQAVVLIILLVFVFRPIIRRIQGNKDDVIHLFTTIPHKMVRRVRAKARAAVAALRESEGYDDDGANAGDQGRTRRQSDASPLNRMATNGKLVASTAVDGDADMDDLGDLDADGDDVGMGDMGVGSDMEPKKRYRALTRNVLWRIAVLFTLCGIYFIAFLVWSRLLVHSQANVGSTLSAHTWSATHSLRTTHYALEAAPHTNATVLDQRFKRIRDTCIQLEQLQTALLYGFRGYDPTYSLSSTYELAYQNMCPVLYSSAADIKTCESFSSTLLQDGALASLQQHIQYTLDTAQTLNSSTVVSTRPASEVEAYVYSNKSAYVHTSGTKYMPDAALKYSILIQDSVNSSWGLYLAIRLALLLVLVAVIVLSYIKVYSPLMRNLQNEIVRTRALLMMLPVDVMETVPEIKQYLATQADSRL